MVPELNVSKSPAAQVVKLDDGTWHLEIPANASAGYRLAQLDDHGSRQRSEFLWHPPLKLSLQARLSAEQIPGTWGFGLWNEPFSFLIAYAGVVPRLPTLPNAVWFFHASPQNYLSFRNDLPANGFLAATFRSPKLPFGLLALTSPLLALTLVPGAAQAARRLLRRIIPQDATSISTNVTGWHRYDLEWDIERVRLSLDGVDVLHTDVVPRGPLSLVIWIDNQYAALPPKGRLRYGTLACPEPAWLEVKELSMLKGSM